MEEFPVIRLIRRGEEANPLFRAVLTNNIDEVKVLIQSGKSVNSKNLKGDTLLNVVMKYGRIEIFNFLFSLDNVEIDCLDYYQRSPLLYTASASFDDYFALELIKRGANIHLADDSGCTFLHTAPRACWESNLMISQLVIEKGADVNAQNDCGMTPLFVACQECNFNWVCMLLYYGADVMITSDEGILPLTALPVDTTNDQHVFLQEILFDNTFDGYKVTIKLGTLVAAMTLDSSLFSRIIENVADISYNMSDLEYLQMHLILLVPRHFKVFIEKFGHIVKEMINNFPTLNILLDIQVDFQICKLKGILDVFLESEVGFDFVQNSNPTSSAISDLIKLLNTTDVSLEEITKIVSLMLTFGLSVTSVDLDTVYDHYGYCELFRILLHMEIIVIKHNINGSITPRLYYDLNTPMENLLENSSSFSSLLDYYNHPKLKEVCLATSSDNEIIAKIKKYPQVPLLVELSRNMARQYIVSKYHIKNSGQFYTVLKCLPIGDMNKSIISLAKKLY